MRKDPELIPLTGDCNECPYKLLIWCRFYQHLIPEDNQCWMW